MSTSTVTDMNLGGSKPSGNGGRRKPKGSELKKHRQPMRGMGMAKLEQQRELLEQYKNKMTHIPFPAFNPPLGFTTSSSSSCTPVQNVALQFHPVPSPAMFVQGIGVHNPNQYSTDHVVDPSVVIGSSNGGYRFENSVPNYVKCGSDGCGVCHKKKRISGGSNLCSVTPFRSFCGSNTAVEMIDGKTRRSSGQVTEVMSVHRNGGGSMTEYEFFPGKVDGAEECKEWIRMGTWCGSGGGIGLRGGEGSCVTAVTGGEEGSVSSVDLSLKLSY